MGNCHQQTKESQRKRTPEKVARVRKTLLAFGIMDGQISRPRKWSGTTPKRHR